MKIIQLTPTLSFGDAVSNDIISMSQVLTKMGYKNEIGAISATEKVKNKITKLSHLKISKDDILIYHMSIGSQLSNFVINSKAAKKIMVYHNITPAHFFKGYNSLLNNCVSGRNQLKNLSWVTDFAMCDSDYNAQELRNLGYKNVVTLPIIFDKNEYLSTKPSLEVLDKFDDADYVNILFVGRLAPNKKQEDIISAFHIYNKYINHKSRLFLIGSSRGLEKYEESLKDFVNYNDIKNVFFLGHISFNDIIAYYKISDIFLCASEHEGFCVPLLEAMVFKLPIIAYNSSAIPYTLGDSGILYNEKNPALIAEIINMVVNDISLRSEIVRKQSERLRFFDYEKVKKQFSEYMSSFLKGENL